MTALMDPLIDILFDEATSSFTYLVVDPNSRRAAVIDSVLDFEMRSARVQTSSADRVLARLRERSCSLEWILETHVHADHLSAAAYLKERTGASIAIGAQICAVQATFAPLFGLGADFRPDGSQFDRLWADGDAFAIGTLAAHVLATPGHTSDSITYRIGNAAFVGDSLFLPDCGTARCDFPGGDASTLYDSVQHLYRLPDATRLWVGHDYPPKGRDVQSWTTVQAQKRNNIHIKSETPRQVFVALRQARDATLATPNLLIPALQVNIRAGRLPPPEANGTVYLKMPVNVSGRGIASPLSL